MGLPKSPLDLMKHSGEIFNQPLRTEPENFAANIELYEKISTYLSYGSAIFYLTIHQDNSNRGFDDITCKKVVANLERSRYIAGILVQSLVGFQKGLDKEKDFNKRCTEHITRKKIKESQDSLIEKMMKRKFYKKSKIHRSQESKLDIQKATGNDFLRYRKTHLDTGAAYKSAPKTQEFNDNDRHTMFLHKYVLDNVAYSRWHRSCSVAIRVVMKYRGSIE